MSKRKNSKGPRIEITRNKVGDDSDSFQAMDPVETWEEAEIAECYSTEEQKQIIRVIAVEPIENYQLKIHLSDGRQGIFDMSPYLDIGVFQELKDLNYFRRVKAAFGGVVWPNEQDLSPETIEYGLRSDLADDNKTL